VGDGIVRGSIEGWEETCGRCGVVEGSKLMGDGEGGGEGGRCVRRTGGGGG